MAKFDKRNAERFSMEISVSITFNINDRKQQSIEMTAINICSGGAFFKTKKPLSVGTRVKISIILPIKKGKNGKSKKALIDVSGSVTRTEKQGMAICFDKKYNLTPYWASAI
jgi:hypothetical protein